MSRNIIHEEFALFVAELRSSRTTIDQAIGRISVLAECLRKSELKLARKDKIIERLQVLLRRNADEQRILKNELKKSNLVKINRNKLEMDKLREENKKLKAKYKAKAVALRQYELLMDDMAPEIFAEDPDEEDGIPSEDSAGAEDIKMGGDTGCDTESQAASSNQEDSDETDPEDSDFELDEKDKAKIMKEEERKEVSKEEAREEVEIKDEEEEEEEEDEEEEVEMNNEAVLEIE